ncbi:hypothetical protein D9757_012281 [Collybiopsis confluens]|uniref:Alpha-type protein kinase domain-containing protein n=1 Tax=Collybiopsis confluens TaxID=2823264 RepID=A0A8H5GPB5_9AGAR|nr:hypothetical protein D9757_012281 [Collybiopsis confluens]
MAQSCPSCQILFPLRQSKDFCPKCAQLEGLDRKSKIYLEVTDYPQCRSCGVIRRHGMPTSADPSLQSCGASVCNDMLDPMADQVASTTATPNVRAMPGTHTELAKRTMDRLKANPFASKISLLPIDKVKQIYHQEQATRNIGFGYTYKIHWEVIFIEKPAKFSTTQGIGSFMLTFKSGNTFMDEIKATMLELANVKWNTSEVHEYILPSEASLRFRKGLNPIAGTEHLKLDEFYAQHSRQDVNCFTGNLPPSIKPSKGAKDRTLYFELSVNYKAYMNRVQGSAEMLKSRSSLSLSASRINGSSLTRKRTTSSLSSQILKRGKSIAAQISQNQNSRMSFHSTYKAPKHQAALDLTVYNPVEIAFRKIKVEIDRDYQPMLRLLSESVMGTLHDKPFAHGGMKVVFDIEINGEEYVAKRYEKFTNTADAPKSQVMDALKVDENKKLITLDAARLVSCQDFLRHFYSLVDGTRVQKVDRNIIVSSCFLLQESEFNPSKASGIQISKDSLGADEGITWLVEPKRSPTVEKFTGTLVHGRAHFGGLTSETVHAFAHFVYSFTQQQLVVADLQGTWTSIDGKNVLILFDPMTHTQNGASGAGDHGQQGILSFENDHECGPVCVALGLNNDTDEGKDSENDELDPESEEETSHPHKSRSKPRGQTRAKRAFDPVRDAAERK